MEPSGSKSRCPICNKFGGETTLDVHLLTHSKESLITTILHLNQSTGLSVESTTSGEQSTKESLHVTDISVVPVEDEVEVQTEQNPEATCTEGNSSEEGSLNVEEVDASGATETAGSISNVQLDCEVKSRMTSDFDMAEACHSRSIKVENQTAEILIVSTTSKDHHSVNEVKGHQDELSNDENTYTILQTMAVSSDDCKRVNEITIAELAGASEIPKTWSVAQIYPGDCNLSTTIKYIIDETDNGGSVKKEEQLIFLDGRYIPVYSSLNELRCSSPDPARLEEEIDKDAVQAAFNEPSPESDNSNLDVDLMTDEEIPPQGEISEFEESSASVMSDDYAIRPSVLDSSVKSISSAGVFTGRQISMSLSEETPNSKIPVRGCNSVGISSRGSTSKAEEFICFDECQNHKSPKQFASLFEMIQHKSGTLPSVLKKAHGTEGPAVITTTNESEQNHVPVCSSLDARELENERLPEPEPAVSVLQRKNFFCLYCDYTTPSKILLNSHHKEEHPGRNMNPEKFECCTCGKIFPNRASLRKHLLIHKQRLFGCNICSKSFPSKYKLMEHTRIHTGHYPYKCNQCGKAYRTPSLLSTHEKTAHRTQEEQAMVVPKRRLEFMCGICHRIMHSKRNLETHLQLHKEKPQKCPHCSETFPRTSVLVRHIRASHDPLYSSVKTKDCSICGKYYHPNSMKAHMLIHKKEKPHKCPVCNKNFRTLGNLNTHSWSHTSAERPHKCPHCPKSYVFLKNLQNHFMVHKRKTLHFVCNECGVKFTNKSNLKRHVEEHTAEKKFKCLICGKKFFRHYYLVEHVRIHSGSRPYTCTICGKASSTKSNHVAHVKIHDARESGNLEG